MAVPAKAAAWSYSVMVEFSAVMPTCSTPAAIRGRGIPSRARCWSSAIPPVPTPIRCSAGRARSASASPEPSPTMRRGWTAPRWSARPARSSRQRFANSPRSIEAIRTPLFSGLLQRRNARQDHLDSRAAAGRRVEVEPAAQAVGHDAVDDMQAEPGATLIAAGREERIEGAAADIEAHAATIVGKDDLDIVLAGFTHLDIDRAGLAVGKSMRHRVEKQIGQHLSVGTGIRVHRQIGLTLDGERQIVLAQARPQAHHHLLGEIAEVEGTLVRVIAVGGDLLERADQFGGAIEIGDELRRRIATGFKKITEARA